MATSCESSLAPTDFLFYSSGESSDDIAVAVERCPLCRGTTRPFICEKCIACGVFVHSNQEEIERYCDRKKRWEERKKEHAHLLDRFSHAYSKIQEINIKKTAINAHKDKIGFLQKAIEVEKDAVKTEKRKLTQLQESNSARALKSRSRRRKLEKTVEYLSHIRHKKDAGTSIILDLSRELAYTRRCHIRKLASLIFSVHQTRSVQDSEGLALSTVSALEDAMHTAYIREQWVYADMTSDLGYRIVESNLSSTGDYTVCSLLVTDSVRTSNPDAAQLKSAHETLAGLAYLAQLTTSIAFILDVNLLRKVSYSDFCGPSQTWAQFTNYVARLNHNLVYLCLSQGVHPSALHPRHTARTLLALVSAPQLGRRSSFDVQTQLFESIEEEIDQSDDSDDDLATNDIDDDNPDWERVPNELPEAASCDASNVDTLDSMTAGSIMTSAAASVMSLWRVATSPFERR